MLTAAYGSPGLPNESPRLPENVTVVPYTVTALRTGRLVCKTRVTPEGLTFIRLSLDGKLLVESVFDPAKPMQLELDL